MESSSGLPSLKPGKTDRRSARFERIDPRFGRDLSKRFGLKNDTTAAPGSGRDLPSVRLRGPRSTGTLTPIDSAIGSKIGSKIGSTIGSKSPTARLGRGRGPTDVLTAGGAGRGAPGAGPSPEVIAGSVSPASVGIELDGSGVGVSVGISGSYYYIPRHHHHHHSYGYPYIYYGFAYPYWGYYSYYGYPYLYDYGCDYYSHFGLRWGGLYLGLYNACHHSRYYGSYHHHSHRYYCHDHGYHYYHLRDCNLCYQDDSSYAIYEEIEREAPHAEEKVLELEPGELSFTEGWTLLRRGDYDAAASAFYNAALAVDDSALVQLYLGLALAGEGQFEDGATALETAHERDTALVTYRWDVAAHFGSRAQLGKLLKGLYEEVETSPGNMDAWKLIAFSELLGAEDDVEPVRRAVSEVVLFGSEGELVRAILAEAERRVDHQPLPDALSERRSTDLEAWFLHPSVAAIGRLGLGAR